MDCTCECDACPDDCENCTHEGCDAEAEGCVDCPMATRRLAVKRMNRGDQRRTFRAMVAPATLDEQARTVDVVWTTGASVLRGYWDRFWEELSLDPKNVRMDRLRSGDAPLLNSHNSYSLDDVIGVVVSARLEKDRGTATLRFARDAKSEVVFQKVKDGILRNISVGYQVYRYETVENAADSSIPVKRATDWEPYELSVVPLAADAASTVRAASATNPCDPAEEKRMDPKNPKVADPASPAPAPAATPPVLPDEIRAAERERGLELQRTGRTLGVDAAVVDEHIGKGTSAVDFYRFAVADHAKRTHIETGVGGGTSRIQAGESEREKFMRGAADGLMERASVSGMVVDHAKKIGKPVAIDGAEFRGMRMVDFARACLERAGVKTKGMLPMQIIGEALKQRSGAGASTGDFPVLLENVLYKVLLASYGTAPDTWPMFCAVGTVSDFRAHKRLRMGSFGALSTVPEGAEYPYKSIPDATKESITAAKKGNIIAITREAMINDDLSAFNRLATMLGRAARLSIESDVYALLALAAGLGPTMSDGLTLFHATHNNISTGAAIGSAALDADRVKLASQTDPSGNEILDLRPAVLVLAVGLGGVARIINQGQYDYDSTSKFQVPNRVAGLFRDIVDSPRLSGTRRYLFADPGIAPTIEVAFLDGQQQPFMEMQDEFDVDVRKWKVRLEYAVGGIDYRGAVTNAGV